MSTVTVYCLDKYFYLITAIEAEDTGGGLLLPRELPAGTAWIGSSPPAAYKPSVSPGLTSIHMEYAGLDLTGAGDPTYTLRAGDIELPCGCSTPCDHCQAELARHNLPLLEPAHTAPLGHTHHWWQRCRPGCPRYRARDQH